MSNGVMLGDNFRLLARYDTAKIHYRMALALSPIETEQSLLEKLLEFEKSDTFLKAVLHWPLCPLNWIQTQSILPI